MSKTTQMTLLVYQAHEGQVDKGGVEYYLHPLHVARIVEERFGYDPELEMIALGHDLLEDTWVTADTLKDMGFSQRVIDGIVGITKLKTEKTDLYKNYKERVFANSDSMKVKWADLTHNMDTSRLKTIDDEAKKRLEKYTLFRAEIEAKLEPVTLYWTFKNDHTWSKSFDNEDLMTLFANTTGLVTHPDIVRITAKFGDGKNSVLKDSSELLVW